MCRATLRPRRNACRARALQLNHSSSNAGWPRRAATQDRLPKSDIAAPGIGQNGPAQAHSAAGQNADLRVCVELRGFEPLTPSMRTERIVSQSCRCRTFLHVRDFQLGTVTASDRTWQRPAAPIPLPESDTAFASASSPRSTAAFGVLFPLGAWIGYRPASPEPGQGYVRVCATRQGLER